MTTEQDKVVAALQTIPVCGTCYGLRDYQYWAVRNRGGVPASSEQSRCKPCWDKARTMIGGAQ